MPKPAPAWRGCKFSPANDDGDARPEAAARREGGMAGRSLAGRTLGVLVGTILALSLSGFGAAAQQSIDSMRARANAGTVGVVSGGVDGTYVRIAADLAAVLDNGDTLRVLPVI